MFYFYLDVCSVKKNIEKVVLRPKCGSEHVILRDNKFQILPFYILSNHQYQIVSTLANILLVFLFIANPQSTIPRAVIFIDIEMKCENIVNIFKLREGYNQKSSSFFY